MLSNLVSHCKTVSIASVLSFAIFAAVIPVSTTSFVVQAAQYSPNFKNTDINEFIAIVGKNLQRTIIVDPNVRGQGIQRMQWSYRIAFPGFNLLKSSGCILET